MVNLSAEYLGLTLRNPIIVSSCGLTSDVRGIKNLENAGAGAVVLKSLFEEQINYEALHLESYGTEYPEAVDYIDHYTRDHTLAKYIALIEGAKRQCKIPVIASVNCMKGGEWTGFAKEVEKAGADALELNIFFLPLDKEEISVDIEKRYLSVVEEVASGISIPLAVKISNHFTNPLNIAKEAFFRGAKGMVMFNRFYEPDINIHKMEIIPADIMSEPAEIRGLIRWIGMSSALFPLIDFSATTGIHTGESVIKLLLAGAKTTQICSVLYKEGAGVIGKMLKTLEEWMEESDRKSVV